MASDIKSQEPTFKVWSKQDLGLKCSVWKHFGFGLVGLEYKTKTVLRLEIRFLAPPSSGDRVKFVCVGGIDLFEEPTKYGPFYAVLGFCGSGCQKAL